MSGFERRMCLAHTFHSWRYLAHLPSAASWTLACTSTGLSRYRGTCLATCCFVKLSQSLTCRASIVVDFLAREAHESIQKIIDAICEVTQRWIRNAHRITKHVKVVPKWCTKKCVVTATCVPRTSMGHLEPRMASQVVPSVVKENERMGRRQMSYDDLGPRDALLPDATFCTPLTRGLLSTVPHEHGA